MGLFSWKDKYLTGCQQIDEEHRRLFAIADNLHKAMLAGRGNDSLQQLFAELFDYTRTHFQREEALMRGAGYPDLSRHKSQHEAFTRRVLDLHAQANDKKLAITVETLRFLSDWLNNHICRMDMEVAAHIARVRPGSTSAAQKPAAVLR